MGVGTLWSGQIFLPAGPRDGCRAGVEPGADQGYLHFILIQCGGFDLTTLKVSNFQFLTN